VYNSISPGWFSTPVFGNNHYLFRSANFWLALPLTICISLAPRYLAKAWKFGYNPDDIDTMRYVRKMDPSRDIREEAFLKHHRPLARATSRVSRRSEAESMASVPVRPSMDVRSASRTDMSTGERSIHRGFDFSTEEGGVAMQRMQTNISERRLSSRNLGVPRAQAHTPTRASRLRSSTLGQVFTSPRELLRKRTGNASSSKRPSTS
jgi:phospholipid-translocating ATPase